MNKSIWSLIIICLILSGLILAIYKQSTDLSLYFLDIGQGDAILIRTPQGQNILIDGGPDNKLLAELGRVLPWWEREIDYLIISHYHADHMVGLIGLLNKYKVKHILTTAHQPTDDFLYQVWSESLSKYNLEPTIVQAGEQFIVNEDLSWQILLADSEHKDYNDNSLVISLSYKEFSVLLVGDLPAEGEDRLLASSQDLKSDILKVAHHGSKYSSSPEFLTAVQPELCIIQSGQDNKFGHPHQETLDRLEIIGCEIRDNQNLGLIRVISDGFTWQLE